MSALFITCMRSPSEALWARLLVESLRECPFRVYATHPETEAGEALTGPGVEVMPLGVPERVRRWPYGGKVAACAHAEATAGPGFSALVWLDLECLIVQPPVQFALGDAHDVAVRPVHIRNVALTPGEPLDAGTGWWAWDLSAGMLAEARKAAEAAGV